jgi:hypothetical protein|tara:strand:+ start:560 stop:967 length:408 start_codon:yes stop_codon:yes gene_type:complete
LIEGILARDVDAWWPHVQEYLIPALEFGLGEYSIGDIQKSCKSKNMQLWVKMNGKVEGVFITKINKYPQKNLLCVLLLGGTNFNTWRDEADALLVAFGKEHNCEYIELFGRKGWGKMLKDLNYEEQTRLFAKEIL